MKVTHKLKEQSTENEINDSTPLGFFSSNKIGGMFFYDSVKNKTQYYGSIKGRPFKLVDDIIVEGNLKEINNHFHTLKLRREDKEHAFFVPFYMNALVIRSSEDSPYSIQLDYKNLSKDSSENCRFKHIVYEKEGRVLIRSDPISSDPEHSHTDRNAAGSGPVFTVLQGNDLKYDCKRMGNIHSLGILSDKIVISAAGSEEEAVKIANHLFLNEKKIKELQERYMMPSLKLQDPEQALAYACVVNGTDHMLLQSQDKKTVSPIPHFSEVTRPHISLAVNALLLEGEFGIVKDTVLKELDLPDIENFHGAAWPVIMLGRLLDNLCSEKKLYNYFSTEEIKTLASQVAYLTSLTDEHHFSEGKVHDQKLEIKSMMLLMNNLSHALTKIDKYAIAEHEMKTEALDSLDSLMKRLDKKLTLEDIKSLFLSAYAYPKLVDETRWVEIFDKALEKMHGDFRTLRSKTSPQTEGDLALELFGLKSLAGTVLSRLDKKHYSSQIKTISENAVKEVLYKGMIGRPSSSYDSDIDPENGLFVKDIHMANNALFLEMIRESNKQ